MSRDRDRPYHRGSPTGFSSACCQAANAERASLATFTKSSCRSLIPDPRSLHDHCGTGDRPSASRCVMRSANHHNSPCAYPRRSGMMFELTGDFRTALRGFVRAPGTSALIVFTLAFAIAAATIGFSFADLALLRGLPVDDTSKVVSVSVNDTQGSMSGAHRVSGADFLDYRERATTIEHATAFAYGRAALIQNGQSQTLGVAYATADFFTAMGQRAFAGRVFVSGDDRVGAPLSPCSPIATGSARWPAARMRLAAPCKLAASTTPSQACVARHRVRQHRRGRNVAAAADRHLGRSATCGPCDSSRGSRRARRSSKRPQRWLRSGRHSRLNTPRPMAGGESGSCRSTIWSAVTASGS